MSQQLASALLSSLRNYSTGRSSRSVAYVRNRLKLSNNQQQVHNDPVRLKSMSSSSSSSVKKAISMENNNVAPTAVAAATASTDLGLGLHFWRLACAFGMVYVTTEYGIELTICEGPSMLPTINNYGEIIMIDRLTPRLYGLQGGPNGEKRASLAREKQKRHEEQLLAKKQKTTPKSKRRSSESSMRGVDNDNDDDNDNDNKRVTNYVDQSQLKDGITWHEPMIPANEIPPEGKWGRLFARLRTGVSVGDVVVVQHPDRVGTVCKRVLGLPGDVVTKPRMRDRKQVQQRLRRRRTGRVTIPDGHIWVEGDNPWNSSDSRNYGPVPASLIVGRVLMRVWPLGNPLIERGARPERPHEELPQLSFSGSVVLPAGYENQVILRKPEQLKDLSESSPL